MYTRLSITSRIVSAAGFERDAPSTLVPGCATCLFFRATTELSGCAARVAHHPAAPSWTARAAHHPPAPSWAARAACCPPAPSWAAPSWAARAAYCPPAPSWAARAACAAHAAHYPAAPSWAARAACAAHAAHYPAAPSWAAHEPFFSAHIACGPNAEPCTASKSSGRPRCARHLGTLLRAPC
jgi:hypothetical protein